MNELEPMRWTKLKACPVQRCSIPISLNHDTLIVACDWDTDEYAWDNKAGVYVYNIIENEWKLFAEWPKQAFIRNITICLDDNKEVLYANGSISTSLNFSTLNMKTKYWTDIWNSLPLNDVIKSIMINNEYHIIGGHDSREHLKWSQDKKEWITMFVFTDSLAYSGLVHLKSKNKLISFGGGENEQDHMYGVREYDITENMWSYLNDLDFGDDTLASKFGYALSSDEKYIFILGGLDEEVHEYGVMDSDRIYVVDTVTREIRRKDIKCPVEGQCHAFISPRFSLHKSDILSTGFARKCTDHDRFIPMDIIWLIASWIQEDYLHLLKDGGAHFKISTNAIISAMDVDLR